MATKIVGRESKAWIAAATLTYELSCAGLASLIIKLISKLKLI